MVQFHVVIFFYLSNGINSNFYQNNQNCLQLRLILYKRAKFYWKQTNESIDLTKINDYSFNEDNIKYDAIQLKIFDTQT